MGIFDDLLGTNGAGMKAFSALSKRVDELERKTSKLSRDQTFMLDKMNANTTKIVEKVKDHAKSIAELFSLARRI